MEVGVIIDGFQFYPMIQPEDDCHTDTIIRALCDYFGSAIFDMSPEDILYFAQHQLRIVRDYGVYDEPRLEVHNYFDDALTRFEIDTAIEMIAERII